jgi:hypothetical protein
VFACWTRFCGGDPDENRTRVHALKEVPSDYLSILESPEDAFRTVFFKVVTLEYS